MIWLAAKSSLNNPKHLNQKENYLKTKIIKLVFELAKNMCIRLFVIDEEATEDNTFANKTFLSIDERFALNTTK